MSKIFISYRRVDSGAVAARLCDRLNSHFGSENVFMDNNKIPLGVDFRQRIDAAMKQAKVVLALIGKKWLNARKRKGRRLDDPNDFVRVELEMALERNIPVIPVLLGDASMPEEGDLPQSLGHLTYYNAIHVDIERNFHIHCDRMIQEIGYHLHPIATGEDVIGEPLEDLFKKYYRESDAIIILSPEHTLITPPNTELIGFRNLINALLAIDEIDKKKRPLIWILDLGRQKFEDPESRMRFLNVQAVLSRFRALKIFEDDDSEKRWQWLQSVSVVILLDTRRNKGDGEQFERPTFTTNHISLTLNQTWIESRNFQKLYGNNFERIRQIGFTIFYSAASRWIDGKEVDLRYFGYASLPKKDMPSEYQGRALELPFLSTNYAEAHRAVCEAAAFMLRTRCSDSDHPIINGLYSIQQLRYLGYIPLRLNEFMDY